MARVAAQVTSTGICTCRVGVRRRSPEDVVVISSMHDVITEEGGGSRAQEVIAIPTQQKVVVHTTPENVVTSITFKDVVPCSADQKIGIVAAVEPVETTPAIDRVGARTTASRLLQNRLRRAFDLVGMRLGRASVGFPFRPRPGRLTSCLSAPTLRVADYAAVRLAMRRRLRAVKLISTADSVRDLPRNRDLRSPP